jgi:hypothetical protein
MSETPLIAIGGFVLEVDGFTWSMDPVGSEGSEFELVVTCPRDLDTTELDDHLHLQGRIECYTDSGVTTTWSEIDLATVGVDGRTVRIEGRLQRSIQEPDLWPPEEWPRFDGDGIDGYLVASMGDDLMHPDRLDAVES